MASVEFNYDINLFRSAITKTDRALSLLQGRNKIISELLGISKSYDGEEYVNSACTIIREVLMTVGFLLTDMSASERQMEGIESSDIFGITLSSDILNGITLDQLLEQLGAESADDLLDFFVTFYEFTDEELNNINSCLEEGKYNTLLQLIMGINRYNCYEELLQAASGDKEQEATINGMLIGEEKRIKFIADYYNYYEALAQGELKNDNSSITDFDKFRSSFKYGSDATSIMIAYGDYLKSNPDSQISGFDLLDYIGENDPQAKNMSGIDLETYLNGAYLNASALYLSSNINLAGEIGKILEYYPYMSEDDKAIYKYKREIEGDAEANKFFEALKVVSLEQKEGEAYGYDQLKGLLNTNSNVVQFFDQSFDSFIRGGRGNLEDIANLFNPTTDLTANDYETMYILKTIQNINNAGTYADVTKLDELKDNGLIDEDKYSELKGNMDLGAKYTVLDILEETGYVTKEQADLARSLKENGASEKALEIGEQLGYGIGYMAPSIAASVLTGGSLGKLVGNAVMFAGTAGGKVGEQLRSGATLGQAYGIALASAGFEVGSGYLIGRIPGLSRVTDIFQVGANDTSAKAIAKIVLRTLTDPALEGIQEVSEDKVYSLITDVGRGREIEFDDILSLGPEEFKTFYMGALTSAVMNAPNNVITTATLPFKIKGLNTNLTLSQILMAYNEGGVSREQFEEMATDNQINAEAERLQMQKNAEGIQNFQTLVASDTEIKEILADLNLSTYSVFRLGKFGDDVLKGIETCKTRIMELSGRYNFSEKVVKRISDFFDNILDEAVSHYDDEYELKDVVFKRMQNLSPEFAKKVKSTTAGYGPSGVSSAILEELISHASSVNEVLHAIHAVILNDSDNLHAIPEIKSKGLFREGINEFDGKKYVSNYDIYLRGNDTGGLATKLYDSIGNGKKYGDVDIVGFDNKVIIMVRDVGHATMIEATTDQDGKVFVNYHIPKICNLDMVKSLRGINDVGLKDISYNSNFDRNMGANGLFLSNADSFVSDIISFLDDVPTDGDMEIWKSRRK